jgi:Holliday junction resolvase
LPNYFQSDNYLKGYFGKDLVKSMLERSGYTVCHYGYEDTLLDAMSKRTSKTSNSKTGRRIRKSPDLLVYDDQTIMLVEVKTRGKSPPEIDFSEIKILQEFWNDAVLAVIVPDGNIFYVQKINELEIQPNGNYPLPNFKKFQETFTRVTDEDISHYQKIALQILQMFRAK